MDHIDQLDGPTQMIDRSKSKFETELRSLADLIDEAAFLAAFDETADGIWNEVSGPTVVRAAASARSSSPAAQTVQLDTKRVPRKLEIVSDGERVVTFWTAGRLAYATFMTVEVPSVLVIGVQQHSVPLRRSDTYPDYYELEGITSSELEQFLERRHRSPGAFPLAWK